MAEPFNIDDLLTQAQPQPSGLGRLAAILGPALLAASNPQSGLAAIQTLREAQQQQQEQAMRQTIGQIGQRITQVAQQDPAQAAALADQAALRFGSIKGLEGAAKQFTALSDRLREQAQSRAASSTLGEGLLKRLIDGGLPIPRAIDIVNSQSRLFRFEVQGDKILKFDTVNPGTPPQIVATLPTEASVQSLGGGVVAVRPGQPGTLPLPDQPAPQPGQITERPIHQPPIQGAQELGQVGGASIFRLPTDTTTFKPTGTFQNALIEVGTGAPYHLSPPELSALFTSPDPRDRVTVANLMRDTSDLIQRREDARIQSEAMARAAADRQVREHTTLAEFAVLNPSFGRVYDTRTLEPLPGSTTFGDATKKITAGTAVGVNRQTAEEIAAVDESLVNLRDARALGLKILTEDTALANALRVGRIQFDEAFTGANPEQRAMLAQFRTLISDAFSLARARGGDARISDVDAARVDVVFGVDPNSLLRSAFQTPVAFEARIDRMIRLAENIKRKKLGLAPLPDSAATTIRGLDESAEKFLGGDQ
ncbi:MAG TPA: hypothetical protein VF223_13010 [Trebonia sp.]